MAGGQIASIHYRKPVLKKEADTVVIRYILGFTAFLISVVMCSCDRVKPDGDEMTNTLNTALSELGISRGDSSLCVITNASYVIQNGQTTEQFIDTITAVTGCSIGKRNLLLFHRPTTDILRIALFNKSSRLCSMITNDGVVVKKNGPVSLAFETINDETIWKQVEGALGVSVTFAITAIAYQWAAGAPYDFLKCAELHNHLCPGITSGYFLAKYIQKKHPLKEGESYTFISCPPWCKDDAIQMIMDLTPGKKNMFVTNLSSEQLARIADPNAAGIMLIKRAGSEQATAIVLGFDQDGASTLTGSPKYTGRQSSLTFITGMVPFYTEPERFVRELAVYEIDADTIAQLTLAGVDPYEKLGFVRK
jgi:formylmethanofuran dehydrogenase subunit E-like metal-binding protein